MTAMYEFRSIHTVNLNPGDLIVHVDPYAHPRPGRHIGLVLWVDVTTFRYDDYDTSAGEEAIHGKEIGILWDNGDEETLRRYFYKTRHRVNGLVFNPRVIFPLVISGVEYQTPI